MKRNIILSTVMLALGVTGWWLTRSDRVPSIAFNKQALMDNSRPVIADAQAVLEASKILSTQAPPREAGAMVTNSQAAQNAEVAAVLEALKKQYGYAGSLKWDEAKALIDQRERAGKALEDRLAALGPGGAVIMSAAYSQTAIMRDKILLIRALGRINDDQAASVLQTLCASETSYSLQREILAALSHRTDSASTAVLAETLNQPRTSQPDSQLQIAAAQALSGRETALSVMVESLPAESNVDVQRELVHSMGAVGSQEAMRALAGFAQSGLDLSVRQAAIQELSRRFGEKALDPLERSLNDSNELIRQNAVEAVARIKTGASIALLEHTAASDPSNAVRQTAQSALLTLVER